jgi:hypothetical protein
MEQTNKRAKYESSYKCASYINLSLVAKRRISSLYSVRTSYLFAILAMASG